MRSGPLEALTTRLPSPLRFKSPSGSPMTRHKRKPSRDDLENTPPPDPNVPVEQLDPAPTQKDLVISKKATVEAKTKADGTLTSSPAPAQPDSASVKVLVRIRPVNGNEEGQSRIVRKVSRDSLDVDGNNFMLDCVMGPSSTQEDVFQLVGSPVVKDSLAGYNTSIICYGETGSGKSYTTWGPLSSMLEEVSPISSQGIATRLFLMLFSEIQKIQQSTEGRPITTTFQCRCSLLEIYDEQVSDLLDPTQRNLEIKDDQKNGFYIENLSEEYVNNIEDVTQILVKGLSNRRIGATSINSKSSRSHVILTCIVESWCKGGATESINSSKVSRINLVDLAGLESTIPDGASGRYKKEGKHIKKSLGNLGKLIHQLAEVKSSGQSISHSYSSLTHILQDTLGGNAKATYICTISPVEKSKAGTLSTLRFAQKAKLVENKPIVNEITQDYVNDLSDQIRQLKEELIKEKTCSQKFPNAVTGYFKRHNARGSLNLLKASLNRSLILPQIETSDTEEEFVDAVDGDVMKELCDQLMNTPSSFSGTEESSISDSQSKCSYNDSGATSPKFTKRTLFTDDVETVLSDRESLGCSKATNISEVAFDDDEIKKRASFTKEDTLDSAGDISTNTPQVASDQEQQFSPRKNSPSAAGRQSLVSPTVSLCDSPKIHSQSKKSFCRVLEPEKSGQVLLESGNQVRSSLQSSKLSPTDILAASLQRGLQIIECHQKRSASRSSLVGFSFDYMSNLSGKKSVDEEGGRNLSSGSPFICSFCKRMEERPHKQADVEPSCEDKGQESESLKRAAELEKICEEQTALINNLNLQVEQFKLQNPPQQDVEIKEMLIGGCNHEITVASFGMEEKDDLLEEIKSLRNQLDVQTFKNMEHGDGLNFSTKFVEEIEKERQRWTESESRWILLTEELRLDLESYRRIAEKKEMEVATERRCSEELDDALKRAIAGHGKMVEHYCELQEQYTELLDEHKQVMKGIAQVKKAAAKASKKGVGSAFARALNSELCKERSQREKERAFLKEQNRVLKIQLGDTAEAVHAAGELLVKLREAEESASNAEDKFGRAQQEVERLRKQMEKMKKKHAMEVEAMKHFMAESRLPEAALQPPPLFHQEEHNEAQEQQADEANEHTMQYDSHSWQAAFEPSYR